MRRNSERIRNDQENRHDHKRRAKKRGIRKEVNVEGHSDSNAFSSFSLARRSLFRARRHRKANWLITLTSFLSAHSQLPDEHHCRRRVVVTCSEFQEDDGSIYQIDLEDILGPSLKPRLFNGSWISGNNTVCSYAISTSRRVSVKVDGDKRQ